MRSEDLLAALRAQSLFLDDTDHLLEVNARELTEFYLPLAKIIMGKIRADRRLLAVIAGPPGSGKSAFAAAVTTVINLLASTEIAALVGLDGWHHSNAYLDNHTIEWKGKTTTLRSLKGMPETYAVDSLVNFLETAVTTPELRFPVYSRALHDPLPAAGIITPDHRIIILEGNYLLLDEPPWNALYQYFDLRIFLRAEPAALLDGLRQRHLRGGKTPEFSESHLQQVDLPNIHRVLEHSQAADILVTKFDSRKIARIEWNNFHDAL